MRYKIDRRSRLRAIATYAAVLCGGGTIGSLVRSGVIADHILW